MASQIGIFDQLREEAHGRELSMRWYRQKVQELLPTPQVMRMIREGFKTQKVTVRPNFGMMILLVIRLIIRSLMERSTLKICFVLQQDVVA